MQHSFNILITSAFLLTLGGGEKCFAQQQAPQAKEQLQEKLKTHLDKCNVLAASLGDVVHLWDKPENCKLHPLKYAKYCHALTKLKTQFPLKEYNITIIQLKQYIKSNEETMTKTINTLNEENISEVNDKFSSELKALRDGCFNMTVGLNQKLKPMEVLIKTINGS